MWLFIIVCCVLLCVDVCVLFVLLLCCFVKIFFEDFILMRWNCDVLELCLNDVFCDDCDVL